MTLLDDLKKQAAAKAAGPSLDSVKSQQQTERNWHRLSPKMYIIYNFLKDLAENLNIVLPRDPWEFQLTDSVKMRGLVRQNYCVSKKEPDSLKAFNFRYDLVGQHNIQVALASAVEAEKLRGILKTHGMGYKEITESSSRIVFSIDPKVTVRFNYTVDLESCAVLLNIEQYKGPWSQRLRYEMDQITDALMDETGKFVLGQPNRFMEMSGNLVSDEAREKLRSKLSQDREAKARILEQADPKSALETTASRLLGLLKK